jgi:hypothetical protein
MSGEGLEVVLDWLKQQQAHGLTASGKPVPHHHHHSHGAEV